ncbi:uncharacterized protein BDV17DRAFT_82830 [Aspergillus undulatus]|uniref:uncharacterized protein n=1 Tax=Aspergillus undulatus TaxID=1810928 RepID=UPI003CCCFFDA
MADVRSLLRNELASRRGTPSTGTNTPNRVTKKRKVDPSDSATRKRVKQADPEQLLSNSNAQVRPPAAQIVAGDAGDDDDDVEVETSPQDVMRTESDNTPIQPELVQEQKPVQKTAQPSIPPPEVPTQQTAPAAAVDEDEWAAFEREVAAPTRVPAKPAAVAAAATISAAPVTAEELAALQQKEQDNARQNREAEAEGEREDAARFLEEEFDEMEQLEERVRRLKQMREQLRMKRAGESAEADEAAVTIPAESTTNTAEPAMADIKDEEEDDDEDDDDADDDWDNWRFR